MSKKNVLINTVKEQIASEHGIENAWGGMSRWDFAMIGKERTKAGIAMHEAVIMRVYLIMNNVIGKETGDDYARIDKGLLKESIRIHSLKKPLTRKSN